MKNIHPEVYRVLKPFRARVLRRYFLKILCIGIALAAVQGLVWEFVYFFVPVMHLAEKIVISGGAVILAALALGRFFRPSMEQIAMEIDRLGLKERVVTACELCGRDDIFACLQREDTEKKLQEFDPRGISIIPSRKLVCTTVGLMVALFICAIVPSPQDAVVEQRLRLENEIDRQLATVDRMVEDMASRDAELTEEEKREIMKLLEQLAQKLRNSKDFKEALKEISKVEEKLDELGSKIKQSKMAALGEEFGKYQITESLGDSVKKMDVEGIRDRMQKLKELVQLDEVDREILKALRKAFEEVAKTLPDGELKNSLQEAADAISGQLSGNLGGSGQKLDNLEDELIRQAEELEGTPAKIRHMLQRMKFRIAQVGGQSDMDFAQGGTGENNNPGGGHSGSEIKNESAGNDESSGESTINFGGTGGESGNNGENASAGSTDGTGAGGSGAGAGDAPDVGAPEGDSERVYDPAHPDEGYTSQIHSNPGNSGPVERIDIGPGVGSLDGFVPYSEVLGEYKRQAMKALDRRGLPPNVKEWVKEYFTALEE